MSAHGRDCSFASHIGSLLVLTIHRPPQHLSSSRIHPDLTNTLGHGSCAWPSAFLAIQQIPVCSTRPPDLSLSRAVAVASAPRQPAMRCSVARGIYRFGTVPQPQVLLRWPSNHLKYRHVVLRDHDLLLPSTHTHTIDLRGIAQLTHRLCSSEHPTVRYWIIEAHYLYCMFNESYASHRTATTRLHHAPRFP